eukprot:gnl/MRDRNA2_/MRDRNA2_113743_c0_seq1.p1 gnl/MRDRNA2_/MRDRNA2_113743_c0~~gnl/MRDRNA2_/MRDRNA2_113743_c0_seq1.p1  ORF type:complete len:169 (+),score=20.06 gnl/MRDRNA2_/MRDRNA2_113743_c0_seq1:154-660(+)
MKNLRFNRIVLTALLVLCSMVVFGQSGDARKKLNAAKIGLITERLGLTPDQAEKFWPLYQEFGQKRKAIQSDFAEIRKNYDRNTATEEETRQLIQQGQEIKQQKLNLEKEYSNKMLNVIDTRQLMSLKQAEGDFKQMLLKKLEQRQGQQRNRDEIRQRNQQRMDKKRN